MDLGNNLYMIELMDGKRLSGKGEVWRILPNKPPEFIRFATDREISCWRYRKRSGPKTKTICCTCRMKTNSCGHEKYQVGWKFEVPKKSNIKEWKKMEKALKGKDINNPLYYRSRLLYFEEGGLFTWEHLYTQRPDSGEEVQRTKFPRHSSKIYLP